MTGPLARATLAAFISFVGAHHHHRHHTVGCNTDACDVRVGRAWARAHPPPRPRWAIPERIVMCESGGRNLPPNSADASGYYQILGSTWRGWGGSTREAYLASKAEQDRIAGRIWRALGQEQWVCQA